MKKTALLAFILTAAFLTSNGTADARGKDKTIVTEASDARITYIGRVQKSGPDVSFDWSGTQCRVKFNGPEISLRCSDTKANYYNVWIDRDCGETPDLVIRTAGKDTTIVLGKALGKGEHSLLLQKRTEGEQGLTTFHSFATKGEVLQAEPIKERYIEFIGDSYTCGYGSENSVRDDPFKPETENCNLTYAAIASRYFDADYNLVSHSGRGIARNYDDWGKGVPGTTMPEKYGMLFDEGEQIECPATEKTPDLVIIYLGTNDFTTGSQPSMDRFCGNYVTLLGKIRSRYGSEVPVLCLAAKNDPGIYDYVKEAVRRSSLEGVWCVRIQEGVHNNGSDLGASWHPSYRGHLKIASQVIPYISTITGWDMEPKIYR